MDCKVGLIKERRGFLDGMPVMVNGRIAWRDCCGSRAQPRVTDSGKHERKKRASCLFVRLYIIGMISSHVKHTVGESEAGPPRSRLVHSVSRLCMAIFS
jgi:hypothetical protein